MKIVCSFGSCLSANVATNLSKIYSEWYRISSVQHNRIDNFCDFYIDKKYTELKKTEMMFQLSTQYSYVHTIDNQSNVLGLGKA